MRTIHTLFAAAVVSLALVGCATDDNDDKNTGNNPAPTTSNPTNPTNPTNPMTGYGSIIDVATDAGDFTTLLAAVDAADLTTTLDEGGPFTVMAPTDDAFAMLPDGTVDALLNDIPTLTDILLYHVVDGSVMASDVVELSLVTTLQGTDFKVTVDGDVFINDAMVVVTDIPADNGVIHVIDTVIIPPASIAEIAAGDAQFSTLVAALDAADLVDTLAGPGPFTVFAPTDAAFAKLPPGTVDALLQDIPALTDILLYHVSGEKLPAADVLGMSNVATLQGSDAAVTMDADGAYIAGAKIEITDIPAANGVIHVIDTVMIP